MQEYQPKVPYSARLKIDKEDVQFKKFVDILMRLHINLPLVEAFSQMPKYAKFMKVLNTNKCKLEEASTISLDESCSAILQSKLSRKIKDPSGLVIECKIGDSIVEKDLAYSGAGINVMPNELFIKSRMKELEPTRKILQLTDQSMGCSRGIVIDNKCLNTLIFMDLLYAF